jgi:hypothetical protein
MSTEKGWNARLLSWILIAALCGFPEMLVGVSQAQNVPTSANSAASADEAQPGQDTTATPQSDNANQTQTPLPDAPSAAQDQAPPASTAPDSEPKQKQQSQEPAGVGAAQAGPTSGGTASKPAGMAIAPAKQRQVRSFLIKLGAVAGGAVAIGTVLALSRSSPEKPPGAK